MPPAQFSKTQWKKPLAGGLPRCLDCSGVRARTSAGGDVVASCPWCDAKPPVRKSRNSTRERPETWLREHAAAHLRHFSDDDMAIERGGSEVVFPYDGGRENTCEFPSRTMDRLFTAAGKLAATTCSSEFVERQLAADEHDVLIYAATSCDAGLVGAPLHTDDSPTTRTGPAQTNSISTRW